MRQILLQLGDSNVAFSADAFWHSTIDPNLSLEAQKIFLQNLSLQWQMVKVSGILRPKRNEKQEKEQKESCIRFHIEPKTYVVLTDCDSWYLTLQEPRFTTMSAIQSLKVASAIKQTNAFNTSTSRSARVLKTKTVMYGVHLIFLAVQNMTHPLQWDPYAR